MSGDKTSRYQRAKTEMTGRMSEKATEPKIIESPDITARLRAEYDYVARQPIPEDLLQLLEELANGVTPKR